jgi:hypothetical protein
MFLAILNKNFFRNLKIIIPMHMFSRDNSSKEAFCRKKMIKRFLKPKKEGLI